MLSRPSMATILLSWAQLKSILRPWELPSSGQCITIPFQISNLNSQKEPVQTEDYQDVVFRLWCAIGGMTALYAVVENRNAEIVEELIRTGADFRINSDASERVADLTRRL